MVEEGIDLLICGQLGAGCTEVADIVASRMNMVFFNTEKLLHRLAADLDLSFSGIARKATSGEVEIDESLSGIITSYMHDKHVKRVIIEGRTAFMAFLEPAMVKVLLMAPIYVRAHHISQIRGIDFNKAQEEVVSSDDDRSQLVKRLWKLDWLDPSLYDLIINTGAWSYEQAAIMIEEALKSRGLAKEA
jgi:cytidylate kinase